MNTTDPFDIAGSCLAFGVRRVSRLVTRHYDRHLATAGMRSTQFTILNALRALEEVTISELAEQLETDRTTLSRTLEPLQRTGWLEKRAGQDKRSRVVVLTAQGREALDTATPAWQEAQAELGIRLGRRLYRDLMNSLSELEESFSAQA